MSSVRTLVQMSDCHIGDEPQSIGVNTQANVQKIVQAVIKQRPDACVISGDLSHSGTEKSYQLLQRILAPIQSNLMVLPGNHDNIEHLKMTFFQQLKPKLRLGNWEMIAIDSTQFADSTEKVYQTSGYLSYADLAQLEMVLKTTQAQYNILVLHHPIVSMQSSWDDTLSLENAEDLLALIDQYPKVKAVLWGHAHQAAAFNHKEVQLIACPSTARQFYGSDKIGFNTYWLHDNGELTWQTVWI